MEPFRIQRPTSNQVPVVISVPHCGTAFPEELVGEFKPALVQAPDDTDWFVDRLYDFAPSMGMTMISARYSRWIIDLNRAPDNQSLYSDGRIITALCPATTFLGEPLYQDGRMEVAGEEVPRRTDKYYTPYHEQVRRELDALKLKFGRVLLWDCHSIRQVVPTIRKEKFPDLILGSADETSASAALISVALENLRSGAYSLRHNDPFKGGYITRHFGNPTEEVHALQLEMCKVHYMDDTETQYDNSRADRMRELLKRTLGALAEHLNS